MPRSTIAAQPAIPANLAFPLSARTMRVAFPRVATGVMWVEVTAGGTGATHGGAVTFTGGGPGSGAAGTMLCRSGVVVAVLMTNPGSGYTSAPTPVFSSGTATGTAYLADAVADLVAAATTHCVWHYPTSAAEGTAFIAGVAAAGIALQGTLSGQLTYNLGNAANLSAATLAFDGSPAPVMFSAKQSRTFGASWRPAYLAYQQTKAAEAIALGVSAVQFDDPAADLIANRSTADTSYSGGPFDSDTLAAMGVPNLVALIQAQGVTQDPYNWTATEANQQYSTTASNWLTSYTSWTQYPAYVLNLKAGVRRLHGLLRPNLGGRPLTHNIYDPFPKANSSAWQLPNADGALFETDALNYSGANIGNAERFTRLWVNIKTCEGSGDMCIPHLQALRNDSVNVASRAQRVALLLQQYALSYALGGRPTYPYDTYLYPFDATFQNERWFAKPNDGFRAMAQMVRDYPGLFDGTVNRNALLLAYDCDADSQTDATIMAQGDHCLRNGVPAVIYPLGTGFSRNLAAEAAALKIVNCSVTLNGTIASAVNLASFGLSSWTQYRSAILSGTFTDCFAIPRYSAARLVVHVVNFDGGTKTDLVVTIPWWALPSFKRQAVYFHKPAGGRVQIPCTASDTGLRIAIPSMSEWGIVSVELA